MINQTPTAAALLLLALLAASAQAQPDFRPVVLTGEQTPRLLGAAPDEVVAFAFRDGGFVPIPVQVDERFVYDLAAAYPPDLEPRDCPRRAWCRDLQGQVVGVGYADPGTHVGADPDPAFDALDELALMLRDFGEATETDPPGVDPASRTVVEVEVEGAIRFAYLYRRTDAPKIDAGYVAYAFALESGPYLETYDHSGRRPPILGFPYGFPSGTRVGSNPEDSHVTTAHYRLGFADRWIADDLRLAGGPDLLDVDMIGFGLGICWRTPYTASLSEGAFTVNRSGPVRALRGAVGFNSGPLVEQTWVFYDRMIETRSALRVHPVPGVMSYLDLSEAARGMTYTDANHSYGVPVDGAPDALRDEAPTWQAVSGPQGTLVTHHALATGTFTPAVRSYYEDDRRPHYAACVGDDGFYGAHGFRVAETIPNTDPRQGEAVRLGLTRRIVVGGAVEETVAALQTSLTVTVR
ncbi:MAG: hypothetical protein AAGI91_12300 [Bacteroidota bacterium]